MEAADFDQDGDLDIVLGSYFHTVGEMTQLLFKGITSFPQLLVLENQGSESCYHSPVPSRQRPPAKTGEGCRVGLF